MRSILIIPPLFLLILCIALLLFAGLELLVFRSVQPADFPTARVMLHAPTALLAALPAAVLTALAALTFRRRQGSGKRFLSFIVLFSCALAALVPGYRGLRTLVPPEPAGAPVPDALLLPGRINRLGDTLLYVDTLREGQPEGLVLWKGAPGGGLLHRDRAVVRQEGAEAVLLLPDGSRAARGPAEAARFATFRFHPQVEAFLADIRLLNEELAALYREGARRFLLLAGSLVFFLSAALFLLDGVRWPLLRVLAAFLLVRGSFFFQALLKTGIADELRKLLPGSAWSSMLTASFFLLAGAVCLLIGLLQPSNPQGPANPQGLPNPAGSRAGYREAVRG